MFCFTDQWSSSPAFWTCWHPVCAESCPSALWRTIQVALPGPATQLHQMGTPPKAGTALSLRPCTQDLCWEHPPWLPSKGLGIFLSVSWRIKDDCTLPSFHPVFSVLLVPVLFLPLQPHGFCWGDWLFLPWPLTCPQLLIKRSISLPLMRLSEHIFSVLGSWKDWKFSKNLSCVYFLLNSSIFNFFLSSHILLLNSQEASSHSFHTLLRNLQAKYPVSFLASSTFHKTLDHEAGDVAQE